MFRFGFELEGFYMPTGSLDVPPETYPTDGFPGLVELRTVGHFSLSQAYANLIREFIKHSDVDFTVPSAIFSPKQRAILRRRQEIKSICDIRNLYGREPRLLGNKTLASLQINVSNMLQDEYRDKDGVSHLVRWGLLDIPTIVRNLDEEFAGTIRAAGRQPGEYAVKDSVRLEYRSLPNFAFELNPALAKDFLDRIDNCIKEKQ